MNLVMTLLIRDEEDILATNFEFHLAQGVDFFIVTDNLSVDSSRDIIDSYVRAGVAHYIRENGEDYSQHRWVTRMARMAAQEYAADWVINNDADEFWTSDTSDSTLKKRLTAFPRETLAITVARSNFVPVDVNRTELFVERMTFREPQSFNAHGRPLPPKVCHRAHADIAVDQGNHGVRLNGVALPAQSAPLRILHFPMRSYPQFENKVVKGGESYARNRELPTDVGSTWRHLYKLWQQGGLFEHYMNSVYSPKQIAVGLANGELIHDKTLLMASRQFSQRAEIGTRKTG